MRTLHQLSAVARIAVRRYFPWLDRHLGAREFVKFCLVGFSNVVVHFSCYFILTRVAQWYFLAASITAFLVAVSWSFYWNRRWTFRVLGGQSSHHYRRFVVTNAVSGLISNGTFYVLVEYFGWYDLTAYFAVIGVTTIWNFTVTKFWAFRY